MKVALVVLPDTLSATWILCSSEDGVKPVYSEPSLIVSPFPLKSVGSMHGR